jgi:cellulose synthase/poly-beta-1,6-N-acetylglucosamine synthase-like glycosyltransferase
MKVAVVVPVRNGRGTLAACVEACRAQTRQPDELIAVDNASSDGSGALAASMGVRVVFEGRLGPAAARNAGWRSTEAEIVAFTDVDCQPEPDWLEWILSTFAAPGVGAVGGPIIQLGRDSRTQRWIAESVYFNQESNWHHPFLPYFATGNVAYRRSVLAAIGGFDPDLITGEDNDIAWRAQVLNGARLAYCDRAVVTHAAGPRFGEMISRSIRYAAGDILLERRWASWAGYPHPGSILDRTRAVWTLPMTLLRQLRIGRPSAGPVMDAALSLSWELGRQRGRWQYRNMQISEILRMEDHDDGD